VKPIVLAIALTAVLAACQATPTTPAAAPTPDTLAAAPAASGQAAYALYDGRADGFTLEHPTGWTVKPKAGNLDLNLVSVGAEYARGIHLIVSVMRVQAESTIDPAKLCDGAVAVLKDMHTPMNQETLTIGERQACEAWGTHRLLKKNHHVYVTDNLFVILATYDTANAELVPRIQADLKRVVQSFKLVP
jgi:hypothetical protein